MQQPPSAQIMQSLLPVAERALRMVDSGVPVGHALQEALLAGYLVGRGLAPGEAVDMVQQMTRGEGAQSRAISFLRGIEKAIQDEASAAVFYNELLRRTENPQARDYIRHAMEDEQKHYRLLNALHTQLTGRPVEVKPEPVSFPDLRSGLKRAMDDEYEAFEFYRSLYLATRHEDIRDMLFEIMTDELEHATRFNYALQVL